MPRQGQHRAIRQILLDLRRERAVELAQHKADTRVQVAGPQRDLKVQLVVARQGQHRYRPHRSSRFERFARLGPPGYADCPGCLDRRLEFSIRRPQHDDAMAMQFA